MDVLLTAKFDELVAERERLRTCLDCFITSASTCALGLLHCPWRNGRVLDDLTVQRALPGKDCAAQLL